MSPAGQGFSQTPAPNADGWSPLPGTVKIPPYPVDGPPRIETYYVNILLGGGQGTGNIAGGNIWCQVNVEHTAPATPTPTPTASPTSSPTPKPRVIVTDDGFQVTYIGPIQTHTAGKLAATFQIVTPDGKPAKGTLTASLGDPPADPKASHGRGELDAEGKVTIIFDVNWPAGTTKLYISHGDKAYQLAEIAVSP